MSVFVPGINTIDIAGISEHSRILLYVICDKGRLAVAGSAEINSTFLLSFGLRNLEFDTVLALVVRPSFLREKDASETIDLAGRLGTEVYSFELEPCHFAK